MAREQLHPPIEPYQTGKLKLDGRHTMYWEESGNPEGEPVAFLHGGPGAGATPAHRRFFDPGHYRIIIYDQRGAGATRGERAVQHRDQPRAAQHRQARGIRGGEAAARIWAGESDKALAHATSGPALQQNFVCTLDATPEGAH